MDPLAIRQIGNPKLHQVLAPFDWLTPNPQQILNDMLSIMRRELYRTGGIGISTNQCRSIKKPIQLIIIGTNETDKSSNRYPD